MIDRQLPLEPTEHINPATIVELMPGIDAVCEGGKGHGCEFPWCTCFACDKEDE